MKGGSRWPYGGTFAIFDVWASQEAWESFESERLLPAIQEVARAAGMEPTPPEQEIYELHDLIRG